MLYIKSIVVGVLVGFVSAFLWAYSNLPLRLYWNLSLIHISEPTRRS